LCLRARKVPATGQNAFQITLFDASVSCSRALRPTAQGSAAPWVSNCSIRRFPPHLPG
jgi:hypothetical protein